jgi:hypothetical protein
MAAESITCQCGGRRYFMRRYKIFLLLAVCQARSCRVTHVCMYQLGLLRYIGSLQRSGVLLVLACNMIGQMQANTGDCHWMGRVRCAEHTMCVGHICLLDVWSVDTSILLVMAVAIPPSTSPQPHTVCSSKSCRYLYVGRITVWTAV